MVHPEFQLEAADPEEAAGDINDWRNWRAPILLLWESPCIRIHIKIKGLGSSDEGL
jgi:hypothetical protein